MVQHDKPDTHQSIREVTQAFLLYKMLADAHIASMRKMMANSQETLARSRALLEKYPTGFQVFK